MTNILQANKYPIHVINISTNCTAKLKVIIRLMSTIN